MATYSAGYLNVAGDAFFDTSGSNASNFQAINATVNGTLNVNNATLSTMNANIATIGDLTVTGEVTGNLAVSGDLTLPLIGNVGTRINELYSGSSVVYAPCGKILGGYFNPFKQFSLVEYFSCIQYAKTPSGVLRLMPAVPLPDVITGIPINVSPNPFILNNGVVDNGYYVAPGQYDFVVNMGLGGGGTSSALTDPETKLKMKEQGSVMLDIYRNPGTQTDANLPVIVMIHGGALTFGSRDIDQGICRMLPDSDVIIVSLSYRLGLLGWMALSEFTAPPVGDSKYNAGQPFANMQQFAGACGNQGLTDCIVALQWIKKNISSFGGNPDNVTLWGECGGQYIVDLLCLTPFCDHTTSAKTLFHKVIGGGQFRGMNDFSMIDGFEFPSVESWKTIPSVKTGGGTTLFENSMSPVTGNSSVSIGGLGVPKDSSGIYLSGSALVNYISGSAPIEYNAYSGGAAWKTWDWFMIKSGTTISMVKDNVVLTKNICSALENNTFLDVPLISMCSRNIAALYNLGTLSGSTIANNDKSSNPNFSYGLGDNSFNNNLTPNSSNPGNACFFQMTKGKLLRKHFGDFCRLYGLDGEDLPEQSYTWYPTVSSSVSLTETFSVFKLFHAPFAKANVDASGVITSVTMQSKGYGYVSGEKPIVQICQMTYAGYMTSVSSKLVTIDSSNVTMELDPSGSYYRVASINVSSSSLTGYAISLAYKWVEVVVNCPAAKVNNCAPLAKVLVGQIYTPFDQSVLPANLHLDPYWLQNNIILTMLTDIVCAGCLLHTIAEVGMTNQQSYSISFETYLAGKMLKNDRSLVDCARSYCIHYLNKLYIGNLWDWSDNTSATGVLGFFSGNYGDPLFSSLGYPKSFDSSGHSPVNFLCAPYIPTAADIASGAKIREVYKKFMYNEDLSTVLPLASTHNALKIGMNGTAADIEFITFNELHNGFCAKIFEMCFNGTTVNDAIDYMVADPAHMLNHFLV